MKDPKRPLTGQWRITMMAIWDKDFLDRMEPAYFDSTARLAVSSPSAESHVTFIAGKPLTALSLPEKGNDAMDEASVQAGRIFSKMVRSKENSASTMVPIQPSRFADDELFYNSEEPGVTRS